MLSRQCGLPYTPYGQHESSRSHVDVMLARDLPYRAIGSAHLLVQFLVDPFFIPSKLLDVLRPLEIAHGDATGVGENVRNDQNIPGVPLRWNTGVSLMDGSAGHQVSSRMKNEA